MGFGGRLCFGYEEDVEYHVAVAGFIELVACCGSVVVGVGWWGESVEVGCGWCLVGVWLVPCGGYGRHLFDVPRAFSVQKQWQLVWCGVVLRSLARLMLCSVGGEMKWYTEQWSHRIQVRLEGARSEGSGSNVAKACL